MTIKKMLLLAASAMALVAFAAPAAAQAEGPFWYADGEFLEGEQTVDGTGPLSFTVVGFRSGPCTVDVEGDLANGPEMAEGSISSATITAPCGTNVPNCIIKAATTNIEMEKGVPWTVTGVGANEVEIGGVAFENHYEGATCPTATGGAAGTLKGGKFNNLTGCIEFKEAGGLIGGFGEGKVNGEICLSSTPGPGPAITLE